MLSANMVHGFDPMHYFVEGHITGHQSIKNSILVVCIC